MRAADVGTISMMSRVSAGAFEPAPLWAVFWAVVGGAAAVLVLLTRIRRILSALRDCAARVEQWAVQAEERTRLEILGRGGVRRAARVDGWLEPAVRCPRPEWPDGPADGVVLRGRVTNRTETPVWDVLAEIVDPRSGHGLPLVPLSRHVLPPGDEWPLEWICGCTVTAPEPVVIELPADPVVELPPSVPAGTPGKPGADSTNDAGAVAAGRTAAPGNTALPVPEILLGAGTARPQLRITFSDTTGRWVRQGAWVAPATRDRQLPPGSAALSRASDELRAAAGEDRAPDTSRIAIEVGLALHEVARCRLGRFSDSPLDLSALPTLLTRHPLARRLRLEPATAPRTCDPGSQPAQTRRSLASLAFAVRCLDERIGTASGRSPASARLLLAHAGSVLTALGALRLGPDGPAADEPAQDGSEPAGEDARTIEIPDPAEAARRG